MPLLEVKNLQVRVEEREILHGLSLTVNEGEVHAIMLPCPGRGAAFLDDAPQSRDRYGFIPRDDPGSAKRHKNAASRPGQALLS